MPVDVFARTGAGPGWGRHRVAPAPGPAVGRYFQLHQGADHQVELQRTSIPVGNFMYRPARMYHPQ